MNRQLKFRSIALSLSLMFATAAFAHDEGHGPKITDQPKQGGMVMPVIEAKDANKGPSAALVYKSEMVRSEDGTVSLYIYDQKMAAMALGKFAKTAQAKIGPQRRNPKWTTETFTLEQKDGAFVGKMPKAKVKPFYIDVTINEGDRKLLTAYENLD